MTLPTKTKKALLEYASTLPPSTDRAQLIRISNYKISFLSTISERLISDHSGADHARRAASLMKDAGAATEDDSKPGEFGVFRFEDGSTL